MSDPTTCRWVADATSARSAAHALLGPVLARPRTWVFAGLLELALGVLIADSVGGLGVGLLVALVPTALVIGGMLGSSYLRTRRTFRARFPVGTAVESEFGRDAVVVRGPHGESTLAYADFTALHVADGWVLLRREGSQTVDVLPQALFPDDQLTRIRRAVAAAQTD